MRSWAGPENSLRQCSVHSSRLRKAQTRPPMTESRQCELGNWVPLHAARVNENEKFSTSTFCDKIGWNISDYNLLVLSF